MAVGQNLVAFTPFSTPVKPSDNKTLAANMAAMGNLASKQLKTVSIISLIHALATLSTSYISNHAQLRNDAAALLGGISILSGEESLNLTLIKTAIDWAFGINHDATLSASVNALLLEGKSFLAMPEESLNRILILLNYKISFG